VYRIHRFFRVAAVALGIFATLSAWAAESARNIVAQAALASEPAQKRQLIESLAGDSDPVIPSLLNAWRKDSLFLYEAPDGSKVPVELVGEKDDQDAQEALRISDGELVKDAQGKPLRLVGADLTPVEHDANLRRAMKDVLDLLELAAPDPQKRIQAINTIGFGQNSEKLSALERVSEKETDPTVKNALRQAIALIQLKSDKDESKIAALRQLRDLQALATLDFLERTLKEAELAKKPAVISAAKSAVLAVERHRSSVNFFGTLFRGLSLGSILLVVALGLAITFGLMGVINMAHGEMIAVGAYTTYLVQAIFGAGVTLPFFGFSLGIPGMHLQGGAYNAYFLVALPISFLAAAVVGIGLERTVIQFLYRRPLESLLATWGVSLVLQQVFRLMFGANNVQVSSPTYLSGNWTVHDIIFGWNRVFVIGFAVLIVVGIWLVLTKTSLGLLMRAVMQNRRMASCMGVRTERVNMLTFGLGSGLAGLAGAFLSQIGNVGPSLGQSYIVDSFMVVVVGGVGNIAGTVLSAVGIGGIDQILQQYLPTWAPGLGGVPMIGSFLQNLAQDSSVFGKILVLVGIILFLQWRPAGIFVTRSRSLD
jgi:urea transport system permease protein